MKDEFIAIIDSGIGGISVLNQLIKQFQVGNFIYFADNKYMPYGEKNKDFVTSRINEIIHYLNSNYKISKIIIACNTASSCLNNNDYNNVVSLTFDKNITYLATPLTKANLTGFNVISAPKLADEIEKNIHNKFKINKLIKQTVNELNLNKLTNFTLGCTHYELVFNSFKKYCKNSNIQLNSSKIICNIPKPNSDGLHLIVILSKDSKQYRKKIYKLLK